MRYTDIIQTIAEVFNISGKIPDDKVDITGITAYLLTNSDEISQVAQDIVFCKSRKPEGVYYFLLENQKEPIAWSKVSGKEIQNQDYNHLDFVCVVPAHRGSNAIKILLYALKEELHSLIIDGAIFRDGQRLMLKFLSGTPIFNVKVLNKKTGKTAPFTELVNDSDKCYLLSETQLGDGKQFMPESLMKMSWYFALYD